jgi:hypothetical protein
MLENIDPYWIALSCILAGGISAIVLPYVGKVFDQSTTFNPSYFVPLCFTVAIGAIGLMPDPVPAMIPQVITQLFVMGYGLQAVGNFATTRVIKTLSKK